MSAFDDPTAPLREAPLPDAPTAAAQPGAAPPSGAMQRFQACRWRTPPENGAPDCCSHRDVLPLTGTRGFDPEAWCPDCSFYKLRRTPKKRDLTEASFWRP